MKWMKKKNEIKIKRHVHYETRTIDTAYSVYHVRSLCRDLYGRTRFCARIKTVSEHEPVGFCRARQPSSWVYSIKAPKARKLNDFTIIDREYEGDGREREINSFCVEGTISRLDPFRFKFVHSERTVELKEMIF